MGTLDYSAGQVIRLGTDEPTQQPPFKDPTYGMNRAERRKYAAELRQRSKRKKGQK